VSAGEGDSIEEALKKLPASTVVDGELVAMEAEGRSDFQSCSALLEMFGKEPETLVRTLLSDKLTGN
jgi:ATP-dependent DNA ligase